MLSKDAVRAKVKGSFLRSPVDAVYLSIDAYAGAVSLLVSAPDDSDELWRVLEDGRFALSEAFPNADVEIDVHYHQGRRDEIGGPPGAEEWRARLAQAALEGS